MTMTAVCTMNNCRRLCPDDEPFCSEHRDKAIDWKARAEAAESSRDDLLRQLEEAKGEVETARAHHAGCVEGQKRTIAELKKAEARRDALLAALESAIARLRHIHDSADPDGRGEFPTLRATINTEIRALRTAHEAAAQAGEVKS